MENIVHCMHQYMLHICNHFQHLINISTEHVKSRSFSIKEKRYKVYDPPETTANSGRGHEYVEYMEFFSKPTLIVLLPLSLPTG